MIIDVHAHIGRRGPQTLTPEALDAYAEQCGISRLLVSNHDAASRDGGTNMDEADANAACLHACARFPRFTPLYWVRPGRTDSNVHTFAGALLKESFVGAVFAPALNEYRADAEMLDPYLAILSKVALPAFIHVSKGEFGTPEQIYALARRHPRVKFVLCDGCADATIDEVMRIVRKSFLQADARLYVDTANTNVAGMASMIEQIGAERVLFGTDAPSEGHVVRYKAAFAQLKDALEPADIEALLSENAIALFEHDPAPAEAATGST